MDSIHTGVRGNDLVDATAKKATKLFKVTNSIKSPSIELAKFYQSHIRKQWTTLLQYQTNNKIF